MFPTVDRNVFLLFFAFLISGSTTQLSGLSFNQIGLFILLFDFFKAPPPPFELFKFICYVILSASFMCN